MRCRGCGNAFGLKDTDLVFIEKVTFSVGDKTNQHVKGTFRKKDGTLDLELGEAIIETFPQEAIYQCTYCSRVYTKDEVVDIIQEIEDAMPGM